MDFQSLIGTLLGLASIVIGQILLGGDLSHLANLTAFIIVIGGTIGAVLVSFSSHALAQSFGMLPGVFFEFENKNKTLGHQMVHLSSVSRKEGLLALENELTQIKNQDVKKAMGWVIDGHEFQAIQSILEQKKQDQIKSNELGIGVYEFAGSIAPTFGMIAAVIALLQVMLHLDQPEKIGQYMIISFLSILYGLILSSLIFLPWVKKLEARVEDDSKQSLVLEAGVEAILKGTHPNMLEEKINLILGSESNQNEQAKA